MNYIEEIKKTHAELSGRERVLYYLIGLSGEVGELHELYKRLLFRNNQVTAEARYSIKLEIGDIYCYLMLLIDQMGFNLDEIQELNLQKLKSRGLL